jgi:hypothetical protein
MNAASKRLEAPTAVLLESGGEPKELIVTYFQLVYSHRPQRFAAPA